MAEVIVCEQRHDGKCTLTGAIAPPDMCEHCQTDGTGLFRAQLEAANARRELGERLKAGGESFTCDRLGRIKVDSKFCVVCRVNPVLKTRMRGERRAPCHFRGKRDGTADIECCGGKSKSVPAYLCSGRKRTTEQQCRKCKEYRLPRGEEGRLACIEWPNFWHAHKGQTVLVLACGPSVLLPGEDLTPQTVDPRDIDSDVVLSTNWAWKWYADICDYQISYDVTPCQGWRPAHVKLLTVLRPRRTMKVLERCQPYCLFPACDYGNIAKGEKLPTSRNSGFAALAMAAYMGAARIRVVGMDFQPLNARMHFYHETDFDVTRRVKSFGRNQERVQADLTRLLSQIRSMDVEVENLSPISALDWGTAQTTKGLTE